jgi:hypothetical protein
MPIRYIEVPAQEPAESWLSLFQLISYDLCRKPSPTEVAIHKRCGLLMYSSVLKDLSCIVTPNLAKTPLCRMVRHTQPSGTTRRSLGFTRNFRFYPKCAQAEGLGSGYAKPGVRLGENVCREIWENRG